YEDEHDVIPHDYEGRFNKDTPDVEWLRALGGDNRGWVVVSGDGRILRNAAERQVLREANLTFFCMGRPWQHMPIPEYAWKFVRVWPGIVQHAKACASARAIFEVSGGRGLKIRRVSKTKDPS